MQFSEASMRQTAKYKKATLAVDWEVTTQPNRPGQGRPDEHYTSGSGMVAQRLRAGVYATDFSAFDVAFAGGDSHHRTTHGSQYSPHRGQSCPRRSFQLSA